ncbi:phosphoinositide phospholipase C 2-like [Impatiens glandulifera]|uniref:phosphoinositide phospholipase C 2-like n=1 Tax=Impatiens glandulifera TaxID=253017 RepID=UPI001FB06007|nr:phosphoinositide phospholipase C 2-like [Impatiens glandulifera]
MSKQTYRLCFFLSRRFKMIEPEVPQEIKSIFEDYSENGIMSIDHLHKFLIQIQKEDHHQVSIDDIAKSIISLNMMNKPKQYPSSIFPRKKNQNATTTFVGLDLDTFFRFLFNHTNSPLPIPSEVHQDMSASLSHYFIYTGHNSYLTGNQFSSDCSDVPIIDALKRGVRVIELDLWPNSSKDNVQVLHGRTLTAPVGLIKCLRAIKKYAFVASEYPVIITLEDHLSSTPYLQTKVAEMIKETFEDILFIPTSTNCLSEFPSPESLKGKIIVSTKPPKEYIEEDVDLQKKKKPMLKNGASEYKRLITIHAKKRKGTIEECLSEDPDGAKRLSLNEQKLEKAVVVCRTDIVRYTQRNILRVFPKATRLDSSNYDPLIGWMHGAQMVAFNMQGNDRPLWLMRGMFRANGGCGYVKKPDILLQIGHDNEVFDPKQKLLVTKSLKVKVYMGDGWYSDFKHTHFDKYSPPDFYVKIGIAGVEADTMIKTSRTIMNNWVPTWEEEFLFPLTIPDMALLQIEVHEYDISGKDDFGGQTCLPVSELRTGIRTVPLHNEKGDEYKSVKLLVRFEFV